MSRFKDCVNADVKSVFINKDEFADAHTLNGKTVICVVDKDLTEGADSDTGHRYEGVFVNAVTIYVDVNDIEARPVEGELIEFDDAMHSVKSVSVEEGVLVIVAEVYEQ